MALLRSRYRLALSLAVGSGWNSDHPGVVHPPGTSTSFPADFRRSTARAAADSSPCPMSASTSGAMSSSDATPPPRFIAQRMSGHHCTALHRRNVPSLAKSSSSLSQLTGSTPHAEKRRLPARGRRAPYLRRRQNCRPCRCGAPPVVADGPGRGSLGFEPLPEDERVEPKQFGELVVGVDARGARPGRPLAHLALPNIEHMGKVAPRLSVLDAPLFDLFFQHAATVSGNTGKRQAEKKPKKSAK